MQVVNIGNYAGQLHEAKLYDSYAKRADKSQTLEQHIATLKPEQVRDLGILTNQNGTLIELSSYASQHLGLKDAILSHVQTFEQQLLVLTKTLSASIPSGSSVPLQPGVTVVIPPKLEGGVQLTLNDKNELTVAGTVPHDTRVDLNFTINGETVPASLYVKGSETKKDETAPTKLSTNLPKNVEKPLSEVLAGYTDVTFEGSKVTVSNKKVGDKDVPHVKHSSDEDFTVKGKGTKGGKEVSFELAIKAKEKEGFGVMDWVALAVVAIGALVGLGSAATGGEGAKPWAGFLGGILGTLGIGYFVKQWMGSGEKADKPAEAPKAAAPAGK